MKDAASKLQKAEEDKKAERTIRRKKLALALAKWQHEWEKKIAEVRALGLPPSKELDLLLKLLQLIADKLSIDAATFAAIAAPTEGLSKSGKEALDHLRAAVNGCNEKNLSPGQKKWRVADLRHAVTSTVFQWFSVASTIDSSPSPKAQRLLEAFELTANAWGGKTNSEYQAQNYKEKKNAHEAAKTAVTEFAGKMDVNDTEQLKELDGLLEAKASTKKDTGAYKKRASRAKKGANGGHLRDDLLLDFHAMKSLGPASFSSTSGQSERATSLGIAIVHAYENDIPVAEMMEQING